MILSVFFFNIGYIVELAKKKWKDSFLQIKDFLYQALRDLTCQTPSDSQDCAFNCDDRTSVQ